jgi:hypothetical protein
MRHIDINSYIDTNIDKLENDYEDYKLSNNEFFKLKTFEEFCEDKYDSYISDIEDQEYERYKDEKNDIF